MKTLEQEAKQRTQVLIEYEYFIQGAKSKWVQAEKIKYALEQLYKFKEATFGKGKNVIEELEQELKELEDETKI